MTAGGAAGVATVDEVSEGDAFESQNTQEYGFQLGVTATGRPVHRSHPHPRPVQRHRPAGLPVHGRVHRHRDQDDYVKLVVSANGGAGGIEFLKEVNGIPTFSRRRRGAPRP